VAAGAGSAAAAAHDELTRLLADALDALDAAHAELIALAEMEDVPMPDEILRELEQKDALVETMHRLPETLKPEARRVYAEALAKAVRTDDGPAPHVESEVLAGCDDVFERVRRARLLDSGLDQALRETWG
jgi:hypothetical protein